MPTADLPGMGASMRSGAAARASDRSFWSAVIFFTCTPGPGCTSNWVTAGPVLTPTTFAGTPNVSSVCSMITALRLISSFMRSRRAVTVSSSVIGGSFHSISGTSSSGSATTRRAGFCSGSSGSFMASRCSRGGSRLGCGSGSMSISHGCGAVRTGG